MNLHVVFVHFPVALFTIYAVLEIARVKKLRALPYWFYLKGAFLIFGEFGALASLATGDMAKQAFRGNLAIRPVIRTHETFGEATVVFFGLLSLAYLIAWFGRTRKPNRLTRIAERLLASPWMPILAIIGFALITITGALGGAIAFGPNVDPVAKFVYSWFNF